MKKYLAALLTALLLLCTALSAGAVGPALTTTEAYCIIDADTGLVLAQQNMNEELHPASITKVMTLGLACQKAQGNWDGVKLTVSHEDVYSLAGTDSSHIALREGEEVPLQDALYGTMIASANDGANLLAEYFGGGTIEGGVAAMNYSISDTAEFGEYVSGPRVLPHEETKARMRAVLADIQDGTFAGRWIAENKSRGRTFFNSKRDQLAKHPMEQVGEELRRNMIWGGDKDLDTASN